MANCIIFNHLEKYYGVHVKIFKEILNIHNVILPDKLSAGFSQDKINNMVDTALLMERPLENAFGENWKNVFSREEIKSVYNKL